MKQTKGTRLYQTHLGSAHLSLVHNSNDHPHNLVEVSCQTVSRDTTRQRNRTTFTNIHTPTNVIHRNNSIEKGNKLGFPFCHRDLFHIQGSHMGIH